MCVGTLAHLLCREREFRILCENSLRDFNEERSSPILNKLLKSLCEVLRYYDTEYDTVFSTTYAVVGQWHRGCFAQIARQGR
jgi:hypothetical protein